MSGILADANDEGHVKLLLRLFQDEARSELWTSLRLTTTSFSDLGLTADASDQVIWQSCQQHQLVLITANQAAKTPDSLEETIRRLNKPDCLPVVTLANADRFLADLDDANQVADRILEYLFDIEKLRGTGRLYAP